MRVGASIFIVLLLCMGATAAIAESAVSVLESADLWGDSERAIMQIRLDIATGRGDKSRSLEVYIDNQNDGSKLFARVTAPAFLNQMKYLYTRSSDGNESKWVSTSRGTRQLSNAQRTEKLFDSDFTTADLSKLAIEDYLVSFDRQNREELIVIRAEAKREDQSTRIITIDPETMLIMRVDYLDQSDQVERIYTVEQTRMTDGVLSVYVCSMSDQVAGTKTTLTVDSFDTKSEIPPRVFSRASL